MPHELEIDWRVHVRANDAVAARRVVQRAVRLIGDEAAERSLERYWKIPEQIVVRFATKLAYETPADAVFAFLLRAQRLGTGWSVSGPQVFAERFTFAVSSSDRFSVAGLEFVDASIHGAINAR